MFLVSAVVYFTSYADYYLPVANLANALASEYNPFVIALCVLAPLIFYTVW
jgi:hypothetical protein